MHPWRDARRARARADQWEQVAALRGREADTLRRDRDAYAAAITRLREQVAALDARNDSLRREVAHWETGHAACERARQLIERGSPTGWGSTS